jgi:hypothetical protein
MNDSDSNEITKFGAAAEINRINLNGALSRFGAASVGEVSKVELLSRSGTPDLFGIAAKQAITSLGIDGKTEVYVRAEPVEATMHFLYSEYEPDQTDLDGGVYSTRSDILFSIAASQLIIESMVSGSSPDSPSTEESTDESSSREAFVFASIFNYLANSDDLLSQVAAYLDDSEYLDRIDDVESIKSTLHDFSLTSIQPEVSAYINFQRLAVGFLRTLIPTIDPTVDQEEFNRRHPGYSIKSYRVDKTHAAIRDAALENLAIKYRKTTSTKTVHDTEEIGRYFYGFPTLSLAFPSTKLELKKFHQELAVASGMYDATISIRKDLLGTIDI